MNNPKLRVGFLLDTWEVPAWAAEMLRQIQTSHYAEICLVVTCDSLETQPQPRRSVWTRVKTNRDRLLELVVRRAADSVYRLFIDRVQTLPSAETRESVQDLLRDVPHIEVKPLRKQWSDYIEPPDLASIQSYRLDVLVRLGFRILRGGILAAAKHGVWSFHHGDNRVNRGGPPAFWESLEGWPETGSLLQVLSEDLDNGLVLYRSYSCTHTMSLQDNRSGLYWKSLAFLPRRLRELHALGPEKFYAHVERITAPIELYSHRLYKAPTATEYARLVWLKLKAKLKMRWQNSRSFLQWQLMYDWRAGESTSLWRFRRLSPPRDRFWADPHAVRDGDRHYVFIEEYMFDIERGHIAVLEFDECGILCNPTPRQVLARPYHLSYPFLFQHAGHWYMVPESAENSSIELYRARRFPDEWERVGPLIENIKAYDATLLQHAGRWWLFANVVEHPGASSFDELCLFYADSPVSSHWTPHPLNPVVSDCKSSRPAGRILERNGRLLRPCQDGSHHYGYGFGFAEIDVLTTQDYREHIVSKVTPNWAPDVVSTHSYTQAGNLHVIDAQVRVRR
jgi:hypothetical protein